MHILSFSARPSPGYPRVLSNSLRVFFLFFLSLLIAFFFGLPFSFSEGSRGRDRLVVYTGVFVFAGVACVGVVMNVS